MGNKIYAITSLSNEVYWIDFDDVDSIREIEEKDMCGFVGSIIYFKWKDSYKCTETPAATIVAAWEQSKKCE